MGRDTTAIRNQILGDCINDSELFGTFGNAQAEDIVRQSGYRPPRYLIQAVAMLERYRDMKQHPNYFSFEGHSYSLQTVTLWLLKCYCLEKQLTISGNLHLLKKFVDSGKHNAFIASMATRDKNPLDYLLLELQTQYPEEYFSDIEASEATAVVRRPESAFIPSVSEAVNDADRIQTVLTVLYGLSDFNLEQQIRYLNESIRKYSGSSSLVKNPFRSKRLAQLLNLYGLYHFNLPHDGKPKSEETIMQVLLETLATKSYHLRNFIYKEIPTLSFLLHERLDESLFLLFGDAVLNIKKDKKLQEIFNSLDHDKDISDTDSSLLLESFKAEILRLIPQSITLTEEQKRRADYYIRNENIKKVFELWKNPRPSQSLSEHYLNRLQEIAKQAQLWLNFIRLNADVYTRYADARQINPTAITDSIKSLFPPIFAEGFTPPGKVLPLLAPSVPDSPEPSKTPSHADETRLAPMPPPEEARKSHLLFIERILTGFVLACREWSGEEISDSLLAGDSTSLPEATELDLEKAKEILGLTSIKNETLNEDMIREAYAARIMAAHPDHGGNSEEAPALLNSLRHARAFLMNALQHEEPKKVAGPSRR